MNLSIIRNTLASFFLFFITVNLFSQCMTYPVSLEERELAAEYIVLGKLSHQHSYWDGQHKQIFTLTEIEVTAWLKGHSSSTTVGVITTGGTVGNWAQITDPSLHLAPYNEYVLFLRVNEQEYDDRALRKTHPELVQALTVADAQGAITKQQGIFHDLHAEPEHSESSLLKRIAKLTGETAKTPEGASFVAREGDTYPLSQWNPAATDKGINAIGSFTPGSTHSGTLDPSDFLTINGSGFGATAGTVFYTNADDGGATLTSSGVASDNIAWNATQIQNKPPGVAGTGPINVNGTMASGSDLVVDYAFTDINSSFASHAQTERQVYKLVDKNGAGGYTYTYNTTFAANTAATDAFLRALDTWRCETLVNFDIDASTTATAAVGSDGINVVFFNAALPAGVLGRANSLITASATGACNQFNTVWYADEIDIEFKTNPPAGCCTWNFGPGASGFLEFDFESVAVHEIGHAHGLGHIIAPGEVMHFALSNGADTRNLSINDVAGGSARMTQNLIPLCFNPAGVNGNMVPFNDPVVCPVLPVQWTSFDAVRVAEREVVTTWSVRSDAGSDGFEVERSLDGVHFRSLGFVPSEGTEYVFRDTDAGSDQDWFYRVARMDLNGMYTYSETVKVTGEVALEIEWYPTVVTSSMFLRGISGQAGELQVEILSVDGRVLKVERFNLAGGSFMESLNLETLPNGMYLVRATLPEFQQTGRFVVAR